MKSNMLSKRIYFTISCIMVLVLFMFQFSSLVRQKYNQYDYNFYADTTSSALTAKDCFTVNTAAQNVLSENRPFVVYIGNIQDNAVGTTVFQWCEYTKRNLLNYQSLQEYHSYKAQTPEALLIDSAYVDFHQDISLLSTLTDYGIHLVFCTLPDYETLAESSWLTDLLGISNIVSPSLEASGLKLFDGFLLGGETWYIANTEEETAYQDFSLKLPWYITGSGTKTYMSAVLNSDVYGTVKNEDLPAILWRKSLAHSYVFCVNGDYLSDISGLGILCAIMYELQDYALYPVINAQTVAVINYPVFAFEQETAMTDRYSRNTSAVLENVIWPDLSNLAESTGSKFTFLLTPQIDYTDHNEPSTSELEYFFRLFHEKNFEAGLSTYRDNQTSLQEKLIRDNQTFQTFLSHYRFLSIYAKESEKTELLAKDSPLLKQLRTLVTDSPSSKNTAPFSYCNADTLEMKIAFDGSTYSYKNDFRQKSLNTALAYSCLGVDLSEVCNPKEDSLSWDKTYKRISTALTSYLSNHRTFKSCTVAESDRRIRQFLAMDYTFERTENVITANITNGGSETCLLLRLHNEEVAAVSGGNLLKLEDGSYLIQTEEDLVTITLK